MTEAKKEVNRQSRHVITSSHENLLTTSAIPLWLVAGDYFTWADGIWPKQPTILTWHENCAVIISLDIVKMSDSHRKGQSIITDATHNAKKSMIILWYCIFRNTWASAIMIRRDKKKCLISNTCYSLHEVVRWCIFVFFSGNKSLKV